MRIHRDTAESLVLLHIPYLPWTVGGVILIAGLWAALKLNEQGLITIDCFGSDFDERRCRIQTVPIIGETQGVELDANQLERATFKITSQRGGAARLVVLQTIDGNELPLEMPLAQAAVKLECSPSASDEKRALVTRLNQFIMGEAPAVHHEENHRASLAAVAGTLITIGLITLFGLGRMVTCTLDRKAGTMRLSRSSLLRTSTVEHRLTDVVRVRSATSPRGRATVTLVVRSGETLELARFTASGQKRRDAIVDALRGFLRHD